MLLKSKGHDVLTAHDGPTALEAALDYRPDVVLLDIGLPGLDGFEVAKRIRQHPALENVVLIAMTGYGLDSDRQRSREAGFDYHLVKPADIGTLQEVMATTLKRRNNPRK
jgi:CheY-like chemotaxis protein